MAAKNVEGGATGPMDRSPINSTIEAHLASLSGGDVDRLADTYHADAVVILNKPLARLAQAEGVASGQSKIKSLLQRQVEAGTDNVRLRDYVQHKDLAAVQTTMTIRGRDYEAFAYYMLRDGKIWRYAAGVFDTATAFGQQPPPTMHPVFEEQVKLLAARDMDGLAKTYDSNAILLVASTNSVAGRARGAVEGHQQIRDYLEKYTALNMQMIELRQYTLSGDTLLVQGVMSSRGIAEHSAGAFIFSGNRIIRQTSSVGPRV